jgi:hypothetical protein
MNTTIMTTTTTMSSPDNMTAAMTMAPTVLTDDDIQGDADFIIGEEKLWMVLWIFSMVLFLCLPFCITSHRRQLCWRRIKERRWIEDNGDEDDWYTQAVRRQQEQRRQRLDEEQRQFQTTRTQQDEIREQYLLEIMKPYTMVRVALINGVPYFRFI